MSTSTSYFHRKIIPTFKSQNTNESAFRDKPKIFLFSWHNVDITDIINTQKRVQNNHVRLMLV